MRPEASVTRRRKVTVYCSLVSRDLVDEMLNAAFQNDDGIFERLTAPNEPSNGALPEPVPAVMNALSAGLAPRANSRFHVEPVGRRAAAGAVTAPLVVIVGW